MRRGRTVEDDFENGVSLFIYGGEFGLRLARLKLLDSDEPVLRAGPLGWTVIPDS